LKIYMTDAVRETDGERHDSRTVSLRGSIRHSFPAEPYTGKVTHYDDKWNEYPELDEDRDLYENLNGRRWTDVPQELIRNLPDGYVLLTDQAFVVFLPEWLMVSLEGMEGENIVREFLTYTFSATMRQFRVLNPEQRLLVRSVLALVAEREPSNFVRGYAAEALVLIDALK
jgi:hypothetical protein